MITVTIKNEQAHSIFHSMIEGMYEVARDDERLELPAYEGEAGKAAEHLQMLLDATCAEKAYPAVYEIPADCKLALDDVIENLYLGDDEEFENSDVVKGE